MKYKTKIGFNKGSESVCTSNQSTINSYSLFLIFAIFLIQPLAESKIIPIQSFYQTQNVSIQSGDTLWKLAQKYYGQGQKWTHFQKDNRFTDPHLVYPGDQLNIRLHAPGGIGIMNSTVASVSVVASTAEFVDPVVLEYEWESEKYQITNSEFVTAFQDLPSYKQENYVSDEGGITTYLGEYVGEKLKLLAARSNGFGEDDDIIRKAEDYRNQLLVERLTEVEVDEKIAYSEKELVEYYEENKTEYIEEETVQATCVSLTDEKKAEEAYAMYQEGIDLAEIAETFKSDLQGPGDSQNDPGNTGKFRRDASENWMPFVEAIFGMEVGEEYSEQMELDVGDNVFYLLFRKESQTPARQQTFEEVRDSIVTIIEQQKKRERILAWVEDVTTKGKLKFYPDKVPVPEVPSDDEESSDKSNAEEEK